jgi:hypothetical protein
MIGGNKLVLDRIKAAGFIKKGKGKRSSGQNDGGPEADDEKTCRRIKGKTEKGLLHRL